MGKPNSDDRIGDMLKRAGETFDALTRGLTTRVAEITANPPCTEQRMKAILGELQAHQRALQTVLEYEARLEKQIARRGGARQGDLDLEAARREVLGALARLAERG